MTPELTLLEVCTQHAPLCTGRMVIVGRRRLILRLLAEGVAVEGEAAPLPGYGQDSLEQAKAELSALNAVDILSWVGTICELKNPALAVDAIWPYCRKINSPAARFCVEMLILRAAAERLKKPLWALLCEQPVAHQLATSQVIDLSDADAARTARRAARAGIGTLKIKCGSQPDREEQALRDLVRALPSEVRVRLDANAAWDQAVAERFVRLGAELAVEWIEDPKPEVRSWNSLRQPGQRAPAFAIDEPLGSYHPDGPEPPAGEVLVLKPMALGGFSVCQKWATWARQHDKQVCISHLLDGSLALRACIALAFAVQSPEVAAGLGQHRGLAASSAKGHRIEYLRPAFLRLFAAEEDRPPL